MIKAQDALQVGEQHLDLLPLPSQGPVRGTPHHAGADAVAIFKSVLGYDLLSKRPLP